MPSGVGKRGLTTDATPRKAMGKPDYKTEIDRRKMWVSVTTPENLKVDVWFLVSDPDRIVNYRAVTKDDIEYVKQIIELDPNFLSRAIPLLLPNPAHPGETLHKLCLTVSEYE